MIFGKYVAQIIQDVHITKLKKASLLSHTPDHNITKLIKKKYIPQINKLHKKNKYIILFANNIEKYKSKNCKIKIKIIRKIFSHIFFSLYLLYSSILLDL